MKSLSVLLLVSLTAVAVNAQQNSRYLKKGSIGKASEQVDKSVQFIFPCLDFKDWTGQRFVFIPKYKPQENDEYGYFELKGRKSIKSSIDLLGSALPYKEFVGRTATVVTTTRMDYYYLFELRMDDTGDTIITSSRSDEVDGLALTSDIDSSRARWRGKTLWYKGFFLVTYNATTNEHGNVHTKNCSPVVVMDIVAGDENYEPVRFILKDSDGNEGYIDVSVSGSNAPLVLAEENSFQDNFFEQDPRLIHKWPSRIWNAIEHGDFLVGMTRDQVVLTRSRPDDINTTSTVSGVSEQWIWSYGNATVYAYFENGSLKSWQFVDK